LQSKRTVRRLGLTPLKACGVLLGWALLASGASGCDNPSQLQLDAGSGADGPAGMSGAGGAAGMSGVGGAGGMTVTGGGGGGGAGGTGGTGGNGGNGGTGGTGGALDACTYAGPGGVAGAPGGFVDPGPFQFVAYDWSQSLSGFGIGPGTHSSARIQADGTVTSSDGCRGHAPTDVLATFVAKATSPDTVAPFLCGRPCDLPADGSEEVTLTLSNRTTYTRSFTCDYLRVRALIDASYAVFKAACPAPDGGVDATPH
jgi:hypothetical protein